jgi:hypothetical protein
LFPRNLCQVGGLSAISNRGHLRAIAVPSMSRLDLRSLALISNGELVRPIAENDKLNDLVFVSAKVKSEDQRIWQPPLVKSAVHVSGNDAVPVIFNGFDNAECQFVADDLPSGPIAESRASPKFAKLVIHQCIIGKGFHKPFKVKGVDRSYEGRNGWRKRGSLQFKAFNRRTGRLRHRYTQT